MRNKNSFKLFHRFVSGHLKTETFVIMYLQQKCQKQGKKRKKNAEKDGPNGVAAGGGEMFYIFATKLTNFLLCGDRTRERCKKSRKMLKAKRQTVCVFVRVCWWVGERGCVGEYLCVGSLVEKKKMAALTQNQ